MQNAEMDVFAVPKSMHHLIVVSAVCRSRRERSFHMHKRKFTAKGLERNGGTARYAW